MGYQFVKFYPFLSHFLSVKMSKKRVGLVRRQRRRAQKALLRFLQGAPCAMARRRLIPRTLPRPCQKKGDTPMCRAGSGSCGAPAPAGAPSTGAAGAAAAPFPQGGPAPCFEGKPSQNTKTKGHPFGMSLRFFGTARGQGAPCCARPVQKGFFLFLRQGQLLSGENQGGV